MPSPSGARSPGSAYRRWTSHASQSLRVSDAERSEVTDLLAQHYGDGRLDQAEFNERVERALKAKTRADLSGLLTDLPGSGEVAPQPARVPGRRVPRSLALLGLLFVTVAVAGHVVGDLFFEPSSGFRPFFWFSPWIWIAIAAFIWLRRPGHHHHHPYDDE